MQRRASVSVTHVSDSWRESRHILHHSSFGKFTRHTPGFWGLLCVKFRRKMMWNFRPFEPVNGSLSLSLSSSSSSFSFAKDITTRSAGQSPTWGRPAPQVRVESQFRHSKFLSQSQWQMNPKLYRFLSQNHVACGLASAYSVRALRVGQYARYNVFFVDQSSSRRQVVRIPPLARKLWGLIRWILGQIGNFHDQKFLRDPHPHFGVR